MTPVFSDRVLYEDNHLLVLNKPAGIPTMGVAKGRESVIEAAKRYIRERYDKPGEVFVGVVSRLDAPVTGVLLFARTSKAANRLNTQFRGREVQKTYWALVEGTGLPETGRLEHHLAPDARHRRMWAVGPGMAGAKAAALAYRRLERIGRCSLVEIVLETGRKHQIRVQFADRGHPIAGDRKYGSTLTWPEGIGLHARRLRIEHPVRREPMVFEAALPTAWREYGVTMVDAKKG